MPFYHAAIGAAASIPVPDPEPFISYSTVTIPVANRPVDLTMRVSAPVSGTKLPVVLLAHGLGMSNWISSHHAYAPLSDFYAARGLVVIQPTHLDSRFLGLDNPEIPWRQRNADMAAILDQLDTILDTVGQSLSSRVDKSSVGVVGHSLGSFTAGMLLGASNADPRGTSSASSTTPAGPVRDRDTRIRAGILLTPLGRADAPTDIGRRMVPWSGPDYTTMDAPALVVVGDNDPSPFTARGSKWHEDAYRDAPGPKAMFSVVGGGHLLGGITSWDAKECTDESPEKLGAVQRITWAYLHSQLVGGKAWEEATAALPAQLGSVETK